MTQTRNGWGPAAPASTEKTGTPAPDTGSYEDYDDHENAEVEEPEESVEEQTTTESRRRVYTGAEEAGSEPEGEDHDPAEQISGKEDTDAAFEEPEEIEEFGPESGVREPETREPEDGAAQPDEGATEFDPPEPRHPEPEHPQPQHPEPDEHRNRPRPIRQPEPVPDDPRERAFDPDAASKAPQDPQDKTSPEPGAGPPREQATYGTYGASRIRRSVFASLRRLPAVGKLLDRPRSRPGPQEPGRTNQPSVTKDEAHHASPAQEPAASERTIAEKPSPQEVQERLTLALRETSIDGYAKLAVGSPKGGVGKSSLAYAIGCAIADGTNIRVCLVDADPEFGATRSLVSRPVPTSIVELARDADSLQRLSDIRGYVAQNERMRLDVVLNPPEMVQKTRMGDLPTAYERIDAALSRFYDLVIYDMGIGFSHPQIQKVLSLSDELLLVGDSEVVPNDIFADALSYIRGLEFGLNDTTLAISHRLPPTDESATTGLVKSEHAKSLRRVTEIPYDAAFSQLLNRRAFLMDALSLDTRLGVLTTAASCLEGLRGEGMSHANRENQNRKGD